MRTRENPKDYGALPWCVHGDPLCGLPDTEGIASFCGLSCWVGAGQPKLMAQEDKPSQGTP